MGLACARTAGAASGAVASATPPAAACLSSVRRSTPLQFLLALVIVVLPEIRSFLTRFRDDASALVRTSAGSVDCQRSSGRGIAVSTLSDAARWVPRRQWEPALKAGASLATLEGSPYRLPPAGTR